MTSDRAVVRARGSGPSAHLLFCGTHLALVSFVSFIHLFNKLNWALAVCRALCEAWGMRGREEISVRGCRLLPVE